MTKDTGRLEGTVFYRERMMLRPGATITVQLEDISKADAMAEVLASSVTQAQGGPPYPFVIEYDAARIDPRMRYALRAQIADAKGLVFTTTEYVDPFSGQPLDLLVVRVAEPVDNPGLRLEGVRWLLQTLRGEPAPAGAGGKPIELRFDAVEGRVAGFSGCNRYTGGYALDGTNEHGPALALAEIAGTMMACAEGMDTEQAYLQMLASVTGYRLDGGGLSLLAGPEVIATFRVE